MRQVEAALVEAVDHGLVAFRISHRLPVLHDMFHHVRGLRGETSDHLDGVPHCLALLKDKQLEIINIA